MQYMNTTSLITHQEISIYYMNFSGLRTEEEINTVIEESKAYICSQPPLSVLALANIGAMHFNTQIKDLFVDFIKINKPYVKASAVVGVEGFKQIVFNGVMKITGRDVRSFTTLDEAKTWIVEKTGSLSSSN
jgi:hypothetical protein